MIDLLTFIWHNGPQHARSIAAIAIGLSGMFYVHCLYKELDREKLDCELDHPNPKRCRHHR